MQKIEKGAGRPELNQKINVTPRTLLATRDGSEDRDRLTSVSPNHGQNLFSIGAHVGQLRPGAYFRHWPTVPGKAKHHLVPTGSSQALFLPRGFRYYGMTTVPTGRTATR